MRAGRSICFDWWRLSRLRGAMCFKRRCIGIHHQRRMEATVMLHHHEGMPALALMFTWQYAAIAAVHFVLLVLFVRFFGHKLKGEAKIFHHGVIIFGSSYLWFLFDVGLLVSCVFFAMGALADFLTGKKKRQ